MKPDSRPYVHGRTVREAERLAYQASGLARILHHDTRYPAGSRVLEAACGIGAQTVILAQNSPEAEFVSVDISPDAIHQARRRAGQEGFKNVTFGTADVYHLPFAPESFDHVFVCFLLEHLEDPLLALNRLKDLLRPGGSITVIEGDHGSALFYPESPEACRVIRCLIDIQAAMGGNSLIGRELWHLVDEAGFGSVDASPRLVYADAGHPDGREGVKKIFIAMVEGVREEALSRGMVTGAGWEKGIRDLYRTTENGGTFCYTFFKVVAKKMTG
ncbi:MAG: methyltransferase domain-containing protein [Methanomicrobiales archaeon]|nr:methyltransferase domain-containing protein [Methanomicrobiales archaeon]